MGISIEDNVGNSAAATSAVPHGSRKAESIRVHFVTNAGLGENVRDKLLDQGFAVEVFDGAFLHGPSTAAVAADIIVIDRNLPGLSSIKAMVQLRFQGINAPIVFINGPAALIKKANYTSDIVCGSHDVDSLVSGLKLAATLSDSFSKAAPAKEQLSCGKLLLQSDTCRAAWNGVDLGLTFGEYRIVDLLASQSGHYFTYRAIYDRLRHEGFIAGDGTNGHWANVRAAIKRIRNKFRALDPAFDEIENYTGFGYRWRKPD
jgi:two-component system response regulator ChvI